MASSLFRVIFRPALFILSLTYALALNVPAQSDGRHVRIAVLDFGETGTGRVATEKFSTALATETETLLVDRDLSRAAARGAGYSGSLNLSLLEARDLGAAIGSDFYIIGESQTLRRSPSTGPVYFESYASLFLVSARTGRLITWERPSFQAANPQSAEKLLLAEITNREYLHRYFVAIKRAQEEERHEREVALERNTPVIEEAPDDTNPENGLQLPRPYRRLRPSYPDTAARADAEGTVDVLVDLDKEGEVSRVEVARWAGFGLDQAAVDTARQLHFFPAMRDGVAVPLRVLLRYNFRRPANQGKR
jgi:TonB family protein